ncbi:hypothetical protein CR152_15750 [Massilia violaceinigra]|uniref:Uncharacterized protein n=1 Tax=Massilia violaceinigra TaxID=2045208 RepID=A0A2D2DLG0_9BURK|nr:hypothetical protein CR152_15750 [Massilia violaceinigra]
MTAEGKFSFCLSVKKAGQNGVENALTKPQKKRFEDWRLSDQHAWFFVDSVDEAKLDGVSLRDALEHIAVAIDGAELRAHVFISGRHADWEFRKDLESLTSLIPVPKTSDTLGALDPNELVVKAMRREAKEKKRNEERALIALMAPLDRSQVEKYADSKGISNVQEFFKGLDKAKLWNFARRPLDLDWLVRFWKKRGAFSNLEKMLELNLSERLRENDPSRAKSLSVDHTSAMQALERLGAALVLEKLVDIEIPDSGNLDAALAALRLTEILPDISQEHQAQLVNSPVFVPSGVGMARLHNDNEGVVRSYLAARWINRMLSHNCPWSAAYPLLFASIYGVDVVKPSMRETAAWLALWDDRAAQEIIRREPILLMEAGDPASLSLPVRKKALTAVVAEMAGANADQRLNHDGLRRFAWKDMEPTIRELWTSHGASNPVRHLLLQMIGLSELEGLADIAAQSAMDPKNDELTLALASQSLAVVGNRAAKREYVDFVTAQAANLPTSVVWSCIDDFSFHSMSIDDLLHLLPDLLTDEPGGGQDLEYHGPKIASRFVVAQDALRLLALLIKKIPKKPHDIAQDSFDEISPTLSTLLPLAQRILDLSGEDVPTNVIDVSLQLSYYETMFGWHRHEANDLARRLRDTPIRRRKTLWRMVDIYQNFQSSPSVANEPWHLRMAGFDPGIQSTDIAWLMDDAKIRSKGLDRELAIGLAMQHWRGEGKPADVLTQLLTTAGTDAALVAVINNWIDPPAPSAQMLKMEADHKKYLAEQGKRDEKRDASWVKFANDIRSNPSQLLALRAPDVEGVDARLYHVWQLFRNLSYNSTKHSMSDVGLLTPLFGSEAVPFIREAFIGYWRLGSPILRSERPAAERNLGNAMEMIGLVGIAVEAASNPEWIFKLSEAEARRAATYGTLELNRFPVWFNNLCEHVPAVCLEILRRYIGPELATESGENRDALDRISGADAAVVSLVAPDMYLLIESSADLPIKILEPALRIARRGFIDKAKLCALVLGRARDTLDPVQIDAYLACAFAINGDLAADALFEASLHLRAEERSSLAMTLLPKIMGLSWATEHDSIPEFSAATLEKLIVLGFDLVRPENDNKRANGKAYSPDERDEAERARDRMIGRLGDTPGAATFRAFNNLIALPRPPISKVRLAEIALRRARADAEGAPWISSDVYLFETDFQTIPRCPADLQRVAAQRLDDLQHHLIHADFGQGADVAQLPHEVEVQRWMADALQQRQGRSFSLEREPHVADEKEPDIRLTARGSDARMPIEIKVAESWSLRQLEEALTVQLQQRYLRDPNARWGILLLVHQTARTLGWEDTKARGFLSFPQVVTHLQIMAQLIAASDSSGPQMQVCAIDVSAVNKRQSTAEQ